MGTFCSFDDLFIGSIWFSDVDIVTDSSVFDPGILKYHAETASQGMAGNLIDRMSVNRNRAAGHIVEAHQQVDKGGFSTAGRTDDCDTFARFCMEIEVLNQFFIRNVAEADIVNIDLTFCIGKCFLRICTFRIFFKKCKNSGCTCKCVLKFCDNGTDVVEWLHVLVCVGKQYRESADGKCTARNHKCTGKCNTCVDDIVYETGGRIGQTAVENCFLAAFFQFVVNFCKTCRRFVFISKCLYDLLVTDHFFNEGCLTATSIALFPEHMERAGRNKFCDEEADRSKYNDHQCDPDVFGKHKDQGSDDGDNSGKQLCKSEKKTIGKDICIGNDTADDVTGAVAVQIGERQYLDMTDRFGTDILYRTEGHAVIDDVHDPGCNTGDDDHDKNSCQVVPHHTEVYFVFGNDLIDRITKKYRYV